MNKLFTVRKELRSSVRCSFCYFADGVLGEGTIWDLSVAGWRSTGNIVVAPGLEVTAYLKLLDDTRSPHLQVNGAVIRWVGGQTMGWEIINIDEASRARLVEYLGHAVHDNGAHSLVARTQEFITGLMDLASSATKG